MIGKGMQQNILQQETVYFNIGNIIAVTYNLKQFNTKTSVIGRF